MTAVFPTAPPTAGWATAQGLRRVAADAAAVRTSPAAFAAAVADGIGDTPAAASAARFAAAVAVEAAWRADVAVAMEEVRRALHEADLPTNPLGIPLPRSNTEPPPAPAPSEPPPAALEAPLTPAAQSPPGLTRSGDTTLVVAAGTARQWCVAWVGDCRAYFLPDAGPAHLLTTDHTVGRYLRDRGVHPNPRLDLVVTTTARKGGHAEAHGSGTGRLVLLTNGVHRAADDATITRLAAGSTDPVEAARALIAAGEEDNAAAVVVDIR